MQPQDDFRIGVCFETHPARLQLGAQLAIVIDFPVVGEHEATIPGLHWLLAAAQIDDTEPPVTQPNAVATCEMTHLNLPLLVRGSVSTSSIAICISCPRRALRSDTRRVPSLSE